MSAAPGSARPVSARAAVWRWLTRGSRHGAGSPAFYTGPRRTTAWGVPKRVWRVFRGRQLVELTPIVYVVVLGGGLAIGVVLRLTLGVWWWMPPATLLLALWLFEGSSAFWEGRWRGHQHSWRTELLAAFSPRRGGLARRAENRARLLGSGLPFFAPAEWNGRLVFGGWGSDPRGIRTVSIVCLPPDQEHRSGGGELTLTTDAADRDEETVRRHLLPGGEGAREWHPITMQLDGCRVSGWAAESAGRAYRYAWLGEHWLTAVGTPEEVAAASSLRRIDPAAVGGW